MQYGRDPDLVSFLEKLTLQEYLVYIYFCYYQHLSLACIDSPLGLAAGLFPYRVHDVDGEADQDKPTC